VGIDGAGTPDEVLSRIAAALAQAWPETFAVSSGFHQ
jgi:hypothetical protein